MLTDGSDLIRALDETMQQANEHQTQMVGLGARKARAEAAYQSVLANAELNLRASGMAAGMVKDVARGRPEVTAAYVAFCTAEAEAEANHEGLLLRKKEIDVLREAINREFSGVKREQG